MTRTPIRFAAAGGTTRLVVRRALGLARCVALGLALGLTPPALSGATPAPESCAAASRPAACRPGHDSVAQAQAALDAGRVSAALTAARCILEARPSAADALAALQIEGIAATRAGEYRRARTALERARRLAAGDTRRIGRILIRLGDLYERQKQHRRAQDHYRRALGVLVPERDNAEIMEAWFQSGDIELAQGRFEEGLRAYANALRNARTPSEAARASDYLGFAQRKLGDFDRALSLHGDALDASAKIADEAARRGAEARARNHLGLVLQARALADHANASARALPDLRAALDQETRARAALREHPDERRLGYVLRAMASIHLDLARLDDPAQRHGHLERAVAVADEALHSGIDSGNAEWRGLALHWLAIAHARLQRYDEAQAALSRAEAIWHCLGDRYSLGRAHLLWAREIAEPKREPATARRRYESALREFAAIRAEDETIASHLQLGRLLQASGDIPAAKTHYLRAVEVVERTRATLSGDDNRLTFFARRLAPYEALMSLLLRQARLGDRQADIDQAFQISERARARALLDHLTQQPGAIPSNPRVDASVLEPGEVMFHYYIGSENSTLFVLERERPVRAIRLDAPRGVIAAAVRRFRQPFEEMKAHADPGAFLATSASFDAASARLLYERLLRPGEPYLAGAKRLTVVPHGPLFLLPFEALVKDEPANEPGFLQRLAKTRFAIDALPPIAYTVSASLLTLDVARRSSARDRVLAFIDPITARPPSRHAHIELRQIQEINRDRVDVRPGPAASKQRFLREAGDYASLYVSAHGEFNELRPWLSGFWLSDPGNPDGALVTPADIGKMKLHATLLTIRACEVGLGRVVDGEGVTGLTRALKAAGAQNLVLSLWAVDDRSSAELLAAFYRRAAAGAFATALHQAKRQLRTSAPQRAHPFFWAPFVLMR